jgi:hypothetical protein
VDGWLRSERSVDLRGQRPIRALLSTRSRPRDRADAPRSVLATLDDLVHLWSTERPHRVLATSTARVQCRRLLTPHAALELRAAPGRAAVLSDRPNTDEPACAAPADSDARPAEPTPARRYPAPAVARCYVRRRLPERLEELPSRLHSGGGCFGSRLPELRTRLSSVHEAMLRMTRQRCGQLRKFHARTPRAQRPRPGTLCAAASNAGENHWACHSQARVVCPRSSRPSLRGAQPCLIRRST